MQGLLELITTGYTAGVDWFMQIPALYLYVFLMLYMALEGITVILPREAWLLIYGVLIVNGKLSLWLTLLFSELGTTLGALGLYIAASRFEGIIERRILGRFFTHKDINRAEDFFREKGNIAVFIAQVIPGVRTLISIPAGAFNMPVLQFIVLTFAGALLWDTTWLFAIKLAGGNIDKVKAWMSLYSEVVLVIMLLIVLLAIVWYFYRYRGKKE